MFDEEKAISMLKGRRSHLVTVDRWQKSVYLPELQEQLGIEFEGKQYWRFSGVQRAAGQFRGQLDPVENMLYTRKHQIPCELSSYVKRRLDQMTPGENGRHSLFGTFWPTWDEPMALDAPEEETFRQEQLMLGSVRLSCPHPWEVEVCGTLSGVWPWGYEVMLYSWSRNAPVWIRVYGRFGRANQLGRIVFVRARLSLQDMTLKHIKHHNVRFVGRDQAQRILDAIKPPPVEEPPSQETDAPIEVTSETASETPSETTPDEATTAPATSEESAPVAVIAPETVEHPSEETTEEAPASEEAPAPEEVPAPEEAVTAEESVPADVTPVEEEVPPAAPETSEVSNEQVDGAAGGEETEAAGDEGRGSES